MQWPREQPGHPVPGALAEAALEAATDAGAAQVEVSVQREVLGLARFANSELHQHVDRDDVVVRVRAATPDGRVGVGSAHVSTLDGVARLAADAVLIARVSPVVADFPGVAPRAALLDAPPADAATLDAGPQERAAAVQVVLSRMPAGVHAAGALTTGGLDLCVHTSAGQHAGAVLSTATLTVIATGQSSTGYAEGGSRALRDLEPAEVADRAAGKVVAAVDPISVDPGSWPVILEPAATGTLVEFVAWLGLGAKAWLEGRSFAAQRMGEPVCSPLISIVDDGLSEGTAGLSVDWEGSPRRPVPLITDGVLVGVVHDRATAARAGVESTGHALPPPNPEGPLATSPLLAPGDGGTVEDLVAGCARGLLVTRFHYTNVLHPLRTTLTGMTRDGTFLIEDGRVVAGVRNLRFTQSALEALESVRAVSSETRWSTELFAGGSRCPALAIEDFAFTSGTSF